MEYGDRVIKKAGPYMGQSGTVTSTEITDPGQSAEFSAEAMGWWVIELDEGGMALLSADVLEPAERE